MPKIDTLFAFVIADKDEDDEGVMGFKSGDTWQVMVGADTKRVNALRPIADSIAKQIGKPYRVIRFKAEGEIHLNGPPIPIDGLDFKIGGDPMVETAMADQKKMEMVEKLNLMWSVFISIAHNDEKTGEIEKFLDAKERIHQLIIEI